MIKVPDEYDYVTNQPTNKTSMIKVPDEYDYVTNQPTNQTSNMRTKYTLWDAFNMQVISRHFSLDRMVKSKASHANAIRKNNGAGSYIPYAYLIEDNDGEAYVGGQTLYGYTFVPAMDLTEAQYRFDAGYTRRTYSGKKWISHAIR
jgi:hypothetical protein